MLALYSRLKTDLLVPGGVGGGGPIAPAPLGYGPVVHQEGHQACKKSPLCVH